MKNITSHSRICPVLSLIMAVMCVTVSLISCDSGGGGVDITLPPETSSVLIDQPGVPGDGYMYTYNGVQVLPHARMDGIAAALGNPVSFNESESCAFLGKDKVYVYHGIAIYTYPMNGVDYVLQIVFTDDSVKMPEGIMVGSTSEQVIAAYGNNYESINGSFSYTKGGTNLQILIRDGVVYSIKLIGIFN